MERRSVSWPLVAIVSLGLAIISINASCTKNQRLQTIHASLVTVNTARDEFVAWDLEHQRGLVETSTSRDDALAKTAEYQARRRLVEHSFEITYKAIALAATQSDGPSFSAALDAVKGLLDSISKLRGGP